MAKSEYKVGLIDFPRDLAKDFPKVKPSLILKGFGLQALKTRLYDIGGTGSNGRTPDYGEIEGQEADEKAPVGVSYLGTPVFMNIAFKGGSYVDKKNNDIPYGSEDLFEINTVLCDVSITKQIITTNIQGVNGSVKEYISQNDYDVTIRGALVDESGQRYPEDQVLQLVEFCEVPDSVKIFSRFLNDNFNIQFLTIQSVNFPQIEGTENVQLFEIKALSDDPIQLTINEIN